MMHDSSRIFSTGILSNGTHAANAGKCSMTVFATSVLTFCRLSTMMQPDGMSSAIWRYA